VGDSVLVKAFVTGATGFIGGKLAERLRERGDEVMALVRSPEKARALDDLGCELCPGSLSAETSLREGLEGYDSVFHVAAMYEVGIPRSRRPAMYEANVTGTEHLLNAAANAGVQRIVYVSTIGAFGNTHGKVVDESYRHPANRFGSYYEETKVLAHEVVRERAEAGAPIITVCPGGVYGPGDNSDLGALIARIRSGKLPARMYPETGFNWVHVDDVVQGLLLAHDKGEIGATYVLGGQLGTLGDMIDAVAEASGRRAPKRRLPSPLIKMGIPFGRLIGPALGLGPNLREMVRSAEGVTYWATDDKARSELGYAPRDLKTGVRQMVEALARA
jgi:nucleoside-diphosphate-sugar epimerase